MTIGSDFQDFYNTNIRKSFTVLEAERQKIFASAHFLSLLKHAFYGFAALLFILYMFGFVALKSFLFYGCMFLVFGILMTLKVLDMAKTYSESMKLPILQRILSYWGTFTIESLRIPSRYGQIVKLLSGASPRSNEITFDNERIIRGEYAGHQVEVFVATRKHVYTPPIRVERRSEATERVLAADENQTPTLQKAKIDNLIILAIDNQNQRDERTLVVPITNDPEKIRLFSSEYQPVKIGDTWCEQIFQAYSTNPENSQKLLTTSVLNNLYAARARTSKNIAFFVDEYITYISFVDDDDLLMSLLSHEADNYGKFFEVAREVDLLIGLMNVFFQELKL